MKNYKYTLLFIIFFGLSFSSVFSQNTWEIYNQSNTPAIGPINPTIHDMTIAKDSTIWFATESGLSSFKGKQWQQYLFLNYSGSSNLYDNIAIDNNNVMWLSGWEMGGGFYKYNLNNKKFSKLINYWFNIFGLAIDSSNTVWLATDCGLYKYKNDSLIPFYDADPALKGFINAAHVDKTNNLWVGTDNGLLKYNGSQWLHYTDTTGLNSNKVAFIKNDSNNNIWILTDKGLQKHENNKWTTVNVYELNQKMVLKMYIDNNDNKWFLTYKNGAYKFDGTKCEHIDTSNGLSFNLLNKSVIQDKNNNIWIGGLDGVDFFDGNSWKNYSGNVINNPSALFYENNKLWVGTGGGGYSIFDGTNWITHNISTDFKSNNISHIKKDKNGNIWISTYSDGLIKFDGENYTYFNINNGLPSNSVDALCIDSQNNIWIGTHNNSWVGSNGGGVAKFDGTNWTYFNSSNSPLLENIDDIIEDKDGNYWFATSKSLNGIICRYDSENWKSFSPVKSSLVIKIFQDSKGIIWFGYFATDSYDYATHSYKNNIIAKYDGDRFDIISLSSVLPENTVLSFSPNDIYTIYEDKDSLLWFGLGEFGALTYDGTNWKHLTKKEGFPWSGVRDIIQDDKGNYYFASDNQGVFKWVVKHDDIKTQVQKKVLFKTFPNPVKDVLHIKNDNVLIKTTQVELYDVNGKLLFSNYYHSNYNLNLSAYPKGVYIVKLKYFNYVYTEKIVKE